MTRGRSWMIGVAMSAAMLGAWSAAAGAADEVLSGSVKEADNKTGQNTNTGSGIKTNHIQNSAVTSVKIKDGGVATADLANGAVTSAKIKDGDVLASDLADSAVTSPKIADGAVTPAKIGFYSRVVVVDVNGGGDFTSPVEAVNAITDASAANPYLVKIMPGVYDIGASPVVMKDGVDIEGCGEGVTTILGSRPSPGPTNNGIVYGASAEIRFLTIVNSPQTDSAWGFVVTEGGARPSLLHVTIRVSGGQGAVYTVAALFSSQTIPTLSHVRAEASGGTNVYGIYSSGAVLDLADVSARASGGSGHNVAIRNASMNPVLRRVTARAAGNSSGSEGLGNVGIYNQVAFADMEDVTASAEGSSLANEGIRNYHSSVSLTRVRATGTGTAGFGLVNNASTNSYVITADQCVFEGEGAAISTGAPQFTLKIGGSRLAGAATLSGAGATCVASYNGSYEALGADCLVSPP